jgi:hypothetical protein
VDWIKRFSTFQTSPPAIIPVQYLPLAAYQNPLGSHTSSEHCTMIKANQICCAVPPIDIRLGIDGLALWVQ